MKYAEAAEDISQDEQLNEVADILALGFLRLKKRMPQLAELPSMSQKQAKNRPN